jgi:hypothetical protein
MGIKNKVNRQPILQSILKGILKKSRVDVAEQALNPKLGCSYDKVVFVLFLFYDHGQQLNSVLRLDLI